MKLKIKLLRWSAGLPVVMLTEKTAEKLGVHSKDRVSIKTISSHPKEIFTIVDTIQDLIKENEIAVSFELKKWLGLKVGQKVEVNLAPSSKSIIFIKKKLEGKSLSKKEINIIVEDVVSNGLSEPEIALFISSMYKNGMTFKEIVFLIEAILKSGNKLSFKTRFVADKHCIGGIAGNRTTPLVVSICAAAGLVVPKTSSRAITSAAGTADVIETIANVEFSMDKLKKIIKKTNACMVWGGALEMVPADAKIIQIEKILNIDPEAQLLASIMAKKLAVGSNFILIDIPYGKGAKLSKLKSVHLKNKFERLGRHFNKKLNCVLTDGSQPIGNGIGPVLELIDIIKILDPKEKGPEDLQKKSLFLAGELLELTGKAKKGKGIELAESILYSGKAFKKFKEIIKAQGGKVKNLAPAKFKKDIILGKRGKVKEINNKLINSLARVAGCPIDKLSGVYLYFHVGDKVKKGEKILTIYSESKSRLNHAVKFYKTKKPIKLS